MPPVRFALLTPPPGPSGAAIAAIQLTADSPADLDSALAALEIQPVATGAAPLRRIAGIDSGIVARPLTACALIMPHAGPCIISALLDRLAASPRFTPAEPRGGDPRNIYPEASDLIEACALDAIARAASPLAIDVIPHHARLWRSSPRPPLLDAEGSRVLGRLLDPPSVVLLGPPNIGKSTLTNTLARRHVSIIADEPGTTRDHVGVMLELAGVVVRWIDAPGINPGTADPIERAAIAIALESARRAELIIACCDHSRGMLDLAAVGITAGAHIIRLGLRADLGPPRDRAALVVSAQTGLGIPELSAAIREALVPDRVLNAGSRWPFHPLLNSDLSS